MLIFLLCVAVALIVGLTLLFRMAGQGAEQNAIAQAAKIATLRQVQGFVPAVVYEGMPGGYGLAIDPDTNKFAIAIPGAPARLYHFSQLVAAEVERNSETITTTNGKVDMRGAAVATALVGPLGLLAGAKTSSISTSQTETTKLALKLYVNDLHTPCFEIRFIAGDGVARGIANGAYLQEAFKEIDAWYGRFRVIASNNAKDCSEGRHPEAIQHSAPAPVPAQLGFGARMFEA